MQSEMTYNGLGVRMSSSASGVTTQYASDGQLPLTISSGGSTTTILYGLGPVAEKMDEWNYVQTDGFNLPRQLTDMSGKVTMSVRYNPWGKPIEIDGIGNFESSFIGTLVDATTGLIYVGNGQYYDPETGRFLTRGVNPNGTNPYVPFDPTSLLLAPLGLLAVFYVGKKSKKSAPYVMMLVLLVILPVSIGLACIETAPEPASPAPEVNPAETQTPPPTSTPAPTNTAPAPTTTPEQPTECANCPAVSTPMPGSGYLDAELVLYDVKFAGDLSQWTATRIDAVREAVKAVAVRMADTVGGSSIEVFKLVYEGVTFTWANTNANGGCAIGTGGCISSGHDINFADISDDHLKARNNVVHELGHAFSKFWSETQPNGNEIAYARQHPEEVNPVIVLSWVQDYQGYPEYYVPGFPKRETPALGDSTLGSFSGFASQQNDLSWQVAVTNAGLPSEVYADQFLGWTFNRWEVDRNTGQLSNYAVLRRDFMDKYMRDWISYRVSH